MDVKTDKEIDNMILTNANMAGQKPIATPIFGSFIEAVDWATMFLGFKSETAMAISYRAPIQMDLGFRSIKTFDGAILVGTGHTVNDYDERYNIKPIENELVNLRDIDFDLSGSKYYGITSNPDQDENKTTSLNKARFLTEQELKGTPHVGKRIIEYSESRLMQNECWFNYRVLFWMLPGTKGSPDRFCVLGSLTKPQTKFTDSSSSDLLSTILQSVIKVQLANYYQWFAYFRERNSVGFRIPIAPESAREIFELRDVAESGRKKAMLHWVGAHYRKIKTGEYSQEYRDTLVKQHMRGETKFDWRGLEVHITPAKYDIVRSGSKKKFLAIE